MSEPEGSFLSRWSRRKALRQEELDHETVLDEQLETPETEGSDLVDSPAEVVKPLTDEDMPPIESMGEEDDYSGFLSPEVSEKLRKVALRKLFHGAAFNVRDGLCEYDEDYTSFEPLGDIITADMRHQQEMLERKAREAAEREQALAEGQALEAEGAAPEEESDDAANDEGVSPSQDADRVAISDQTEDRQAIPSGEAALDPQGSKPEQIGAPASSEGEIVRHSDDLTPPKKQEKG